MPYFKPFPNCVTATARNQTNLTSSYFIRRLHTWSICELKNKSQLHVVIDLKIF